MNHVAELPLQSLKDLAVVRAIVYALAGIILWDFFSTLRFDIDFVRGKTSRSWPLIVYFWARYSSLLFVGAVVPQAGASFRIKCEGVWVTLLLATTFQKCFGQALFLIRACAIWQWNACVVTFLAVLWLAHLSISLIPLGLDTMSWLPDALLPGYGTCVTDVYSWPVGVSYVVALSLDLCAVALAAHKLMKIRHTARSSFWNILINDGISWCFMTMGPTAAAIFCFYLGKTVPAQSAALVISSTMHSLLACRAYRNLSDFADTLPTSFCPKKRVANGTMLDPDTLARLAWMTGGAPGDAISGETTIQAVKVETAPPAAGGKRSLLAHVGSFVSSPRRPTSPKESESGSSFSRLFQTTGSGSSTSGPPMRQGSMTSTMEMSRPDSAVTHIPLSPTPSSHLTLDYHPNWNHHRRDLASTGGAEHPDPGLAGVQVITHCAMHEEEIDQRAVDMELHRPFGSRLMQHSAAHTSRFEQRRPETSRGMADHERHHRHRLSFSSLQLQHQQQQQQQHQRRIESHENLRAVSGGSAESSSLQSASSSMSRS